MFHSADFALFSCKHIDLMRSYVSPVRDRPDEKRESNYGKISHCL